MKKHIVVILLVTILVVDLVSYISLQHEIHNFKNKNESLNSSIADLNSEVRNSSAIVRKILEKQESLLETWSIEYGDINKDFTIPTTVTIIPKVITNNSKVTLQLGEKCINMKRKGNYFIGTIPISVFKTFDIGIIIKENDIQQWEILSEGILIRDEYLPLLCTKFNGASNYLAQEKINYNGNFSFEIKAADIFKIEMAEMIIKVDDAEVRKMPLKVLAGSSIDSISFNESIFLKPSETLEISINLKDNYGLKYVYLIERTKVLENGGLDKFDLWDAYNSARVFDQNGNKLCEPSFFEVDGSNLGNIVQ